MQREDVREILRRHGWFESLPEQLSQAIIERSVQREVAAGALVYATGDTVNGQFAVLSGEVRLVANANDGKHILYRVLPPGAWFGHLSVLDQQPRFQDAVATAPATILHLPMTAFNSIISEEPRHILHFSQLICQDIRVAMSMLAEMKAMPLPSRVAQVLLQTCDVHASESEGCKLTQESLAAMVGTSRQTVNRVLRRFENRNLIRVEYGRVVVCDPSRLASAAGKDPTGMRPKRRLSSPVFTAH